MVFDTPSPIARPEPLLGYARARDGVRIATASYGCGHETRAPLVFAHGFGQSRHAWDTSAAALAATGRRAITVDGRGHGASDWSPTGAYTLDDFVGDVVVLVNQLPERPVLVGASMGGLVAMLAEAEHGPLFRALVLVDITPRWETAGVERILRFMRARPEGFADLDDADRAIREYLPHRADARAPERLAKLLVALPDGRLRWHWDPALLEAAEREAASWGPRLAAAAAKLTLPLQLISGERSDVVSRHTIDEFLTLAPHAEHVALAGVTHHVAGDDNDAFSGAVSAFLDRLDLAGAHVAAGATRNLKPESRIIGEPSA